MTYEASRIDREVIFSPLVLTKLRMIPIYFLSSDVLSVSKILPQLWPQPAYQLDQNLKVIQFHKKFQILALLDFNIRLDSGDTIAQLSLE